MKIAFERKANSLEQGPGPHNLDTPPDRTYASPALYQRELAGYENDLQSMTSELQSVLRKQPNEVEPGRMSSLMRKAVQIRDNIRQACNTHIDLELKSKSERVLQQANDLIRKIGDRIGVETTLVADTQPITIEDDMSISNPTSPAPTKPTQMTQWDKDVLTRRQVMTRIELELKPIEEMVMENRVKGLSAKYWADKLPEYVREVDSLAIRGDERDVLARREHILKRIEGMGARLLYLASQPAVTHAPAPKAQPQTIQPTVDTTVPNHTQQTDRLPRDNRSHILSQAREKLMAITDELQSTHTHRTAEFQPERLNRLLDELGLLSDTVRQIVIYQNEVDLRENRDDLCGKISSSIDWIKNRMAYMAQPIPMEGGDGVPLLHSTLQGQNMEPNIPNKQTHNTNGRTQERQSHDGIGSNPDDGIRVTGSNHNENELKNRYGKRDQSRRPKLFAQSPYSTAPESGDESHSDPDENKFDKKYRKKDQKLRFQSEDGQDSVADDQSKSGGFMKNRYQCFHPTTPLRKQEYEEFEPVARPMKYKQMDASQKLQFVARVLGNRRFDGTSTDGTKISIEELIGNLEHCQECSGLTDREILDLLTPMMAGEAWTWWKSHKKQMRTLDEFGTLIKSRFGGRSTRRYNLMAEFVTRKQGEQESLLAYMDLMRQKAAEIDPPMEEAEVVAIIVDNTNDACRAHMATRRYETLDELNRMMEYLVQSKIPGAIPSNRKQTLTTLPANRGYLSTYKSGHAKVHAVETEENGETKSSEPKPSELGVEANGIASLVIDAVRRDLRAHYRPNPDKIQSDNAQQQTGDQRENSYQSNQNRSGYVNQYSNQNPNYNGCFGCGTPNVRIRDCVQCNSKKNDSASGTVENAMKSTQEDSLPAIRQQVNEIMEHLKNGNAVQSSIKAEQTRI